MTPPKFERIGLGLYFLGVLLSLWGISPRLAAEKEHQTTEIVLDAGALLDWQKLLGEEGGELPRRLLDRGISSLAFPELHLNDLLEEGLAVVQTSPQFALTLTAGGLGDVEPGQLAILESQLQTEATGVYLIFKSAETSAELLPQLKILFGEKVESFLEGRVLWLPEAQKNLQGVGLGFDRRQLKALHLLGFSFWLRPENRAGMSQQQMEALFTEWGRLPGVQGVIFSGPLNEAIGYPDLLEQSAQEIQKLNWKLGYIELPPRAQQDGIETLVRSLPERTVRVMAVSPAHQAKLAAFRVLGMYSLGARERNIRLLYVRPYGVAGRPELDEEFLFSLPGELHKVGPASLFAAAESNGPSTLLTMILAICSGALALLLVGAMGIQVRGLWWSLLLLGPLGALGASLVGKSVLFRSLLALAVGMGAPLFAFLRWVYPVVAGESKKSGLMEGIKLLFWVSLMSLTAGFYLAALLSDTTFLLGLDRFRGVKILTLGTPFLILLCFVLKRYSWAQIGAGLRSYVAVYQALLAGCLLLVFGFLYLRTGNDAGGAASESERTLRVVLDKVLGVRPRFKEFLLAHPAMVVTPLFAAKLGFLPTLLLVLLAGVGQAGIVDTFAHIHTPLDVTLIRVFLGVGLGAIVGTLLGGLFKAMEPIVERKIVSLFGPAG